ncbi:MAG: DMT family transporter [Candidatus Limnocylindria bacterium]
MAALLLAEAGVVAKMTPGAHPIATNAVGMLAGVALLVPISLLAGEDWVLPRQADTWAAVAYLVLAGSVAVFWLFIFVVRRWTASAVSFQFLLIPLATIPFSAVLTGEVITPLMLVGGAVVLSGVYIGAFAATLTNGQLDDQGGRHAPAPHEKRASGGDDDIRCLEHADGDTKMNWPWLPAADNAERPRASMLGDSGARTATARWLGIGTLSDDNA